MSYAQYNNNPYAQGPAAEGGYGYDGQNQGQYEMQPYGEQPRQPNPYSSQPATGQTLSQQDFLGRISELRKEIGQLTADVDYISQLHQRALASTDATASQSLEQYLANTQARNRRIKDAIKDLERDLAATPDGSRTAKQSQLNALKNSFKAELQRFQSVEADYERRYRDQIARQYRIVNPDATEDQVRQAAEADWGDEGVFQSALRENRNRQATAVLGNVRARHNELQRIEKTMRELAYLFEDLATMVEQQQPVVDQAENNAVQTVENIHKGNEQVEVATKHARNARKWKWWLVLVVILILIAIALIVGLVVGLQKANQSATQ